MAPAIQFLDKNFATGVDLDDTLSSTCCTNTNDKLFLLVVYLKPKELLSMTLLRINNKRRISLTSQWSLAPTGKL
jgi:hypothetical protein